MTYAQFQDTLNARGMFKIRPSLDRIRKTLRLLGNPQDKIPALHIAGTNGKGSVAASLESVLRASGYRTGLYTSPHLIDLRERVKIDGQPLIQGFVDAAEKVLRAEKKARVSLTYFELMTALAFQAFADKKVDLMILECGLGGLWDATNVIPKPLVSIITSIGLEHTDWLGTTEHEIAQQKAGIIKPQGTVISGISGPGQNVVAQKAREKKATLLQLGIHFVAEGLASSWRAGKQSIRFTSVEKSSITITFNLLGHHQIRNAALTLAAVEVLKKQGWTIPKQAIEQGMRHVVWPGRLQWVRRKELPSLLLDGAHNPPAMKTLLEELESSQFRNIPKTFVFSAFKDKDYTTMGAMISRAAAEVCLCPLPSARAASLKNLRIAFKEVQGPIRILNSPEEALGCAIRDTPKDGIIIVCGSLYLVGELLALLENKKHFEEKTHA